MSVPSGITIEPNNGDVIESSRVREARKQVNPYRYVEGLDRNVVGTTLTLLASPAWTGVAAGNLLKRPDTEANHVETLTDDATNYIFWAGSNGNIEVNTTGTPSDPDSVPLYRITLAASAVTENVDLRKTDFVFPDALEVQGNVDAGENALLAGTGTLETNEPEWVWKDGMTERKIRLVGTQLQVLDEGDTVLTVDLGNISTTVESKTANFTAAVNTSYLVDHATPATRIIATLPGTHSDGDTILFLGGANTAGFRVKEDGTAMDPIHFLSSVTAGTGSDFWQCASPWRALRVVSQDGDWRVEDALGAFTNTAAVEENGFLKRDGSIALTGDLSFGGNRGTNLEGIDTQTGVDGSSDFPINTFNGVKHYTNRQEITDLSTSDVNLFGDLQSIVGTQCWFIETIDSHVGSFCINTGVEVGSIHRYSSFGAANCTVNEISEGVFEVTIQGDARTYTLTLTTGAAQARLKTSSTATGTTTIAMVAWAI